MSEKSCLLSSKSLMKDNISLSKSPTGSSEGDPNDSAADE